jgi:hypothetical protein
MRRLVPPGSHSSSNNPDEHEDLLELDQIFKNPQPLTRTSDAIHNPLSAISNEAPALVNDKVSPNLLLGQKINVLPSYDTNELMVSFTTSNQSSEPAFQEVMKCKMEAEKEKAAIEKYCFLMFLFEKKASNTITNKEFELFKNT